MEIALRKIVEIEDGKILLEIPKEFTGKMVEVIILPFSNLISKVEENNNFLNLLKDGPVWTEEEYQFFEEKRKHLREKIIV